MATKFSQILVVDDEPEHLTVVAEYLTNAGFDILEALDGAAMWRALAKHHVDLIILDVILPDGDGLALLRELRKSRDIPVILLTGRTDSIDRVVGLEVGADDYLTKPVDLRELLARVRSVSRRYQLQNQAPAFAPTAGTKAFSGWNLDSEHRTLHASSGKEVALTSSEFDLLDVLVSNAQRPMSREELLEMTQSRNWTPVDRSIDVAIARLRKKLEPNARRPALIKTVHNVGYVLATQVTHGHSRD